MEFFALRVFHPHGKSSAHSSNLLKGMDIQHLFELKVTPKNQFFLGGD